ncbi:MAG: exo-alpha-sialidase [Anaerolineae bacterium]|nr:exo-alpha-sialidase [Anaerolineae bacterium]
MSNARRISIAWVVICLLLLGGPKTGSAQTDGALWSQPVNLSRSGAGEAPVLIVGPEQQIQVFWWDRFNGLTTSYTLDDDWSDPMPAPVQMIEVEGEGVSARVVTSTISFMPYIVGAGETALALWLGEADPDTNLPPLLYSRLLLGTAEWTAPEVLVMSATTWELTNDSQGVLHLIYCQTQELNAVPAGVYHMRSTDGGVTWSAPTVLYASLYARLWAADTVHLSIAADALGSVLVGWDDPRQESAFYVLSTDGGVSWSEPTTVQNGEIVGLHPRFVALPASLSHGEQPGFVMLWEQGGVASTCVLRQQCSEDGGRTWSAASRIFEDLALCPVQITTARTTMDLVLLMRGEGAEYLLAAAWDGERWSAIKQLSFSFENPQTNEMIYLQSLQADVTSDNALVVVGQGQDGDIWALQGQNDAVEWAFAPSSPWTDLTMMLEDEGISGLPAVATDAEGIVHVLWAAAVTSGKSGSTLYYSRWDRTSWSQPVAILDNDEVMAQAPALIFVEPFLHAVWNAGSTGTVFYGRVYPSDAYSANGWDRQEISDEAAVGGTPSITVDLLGQLHVVYAVPFNEGRGIYYTHSDDNGESWQDIKLFDADAAGWLSVDHPSVSVDERGAIHVVWVRASLPGYGVSQGLYYAQSTDRGETWADAILLADGAYDWPQVAATLTGQIVVTWQDLANNIVEYRDSSDYGLTWGYVSQIPGLQAVEGRTVLVQDRTERLHITALDTQVGSSVMLHYLTYTEGQWSSPDSVELEGIYTPVDGAAPAVNSELGLIDVVGLGSRRDDDGLMPVIWHTRRIIESQTASEPNFAPAPTSTPTPGPTPLPTPTPRPVVDPYPPQPSAPVLSLGPLTLPMLAFGGIGIALLLVVGLVVMKAIKR